MRLRLPLPAAPLVALLAAAGAAAVAAPATARAQVLLDPPSGTPGQTVVARGTLPPAQRDLAALPWSVLPQGPVNIVAQDANPNTGAFTLTLSIAPTAPFGAYQIVANVAGAGTVPIAVFQVRPLAAERVVGPRIDAIRPSTLAQGGQYHLEIAGKNLSLTTRIDLGPGLQILGAPVVHSPTVAVLDVLVSPAAPLGPREAVASDATGSNTGPGGVLIVPQLPAPGPAKPVAAARQRLVPRLEVIDVLGPLDPDSARCVPSRDRACEAPHAFVGTRFTWRERVPGLASYFVWELVDCSGKVLASAQTRRPELVLTEALVAALPPVDPAGQPREAACTFRKLGSAGAFAADLKPVVTSTTATERARRALGPWSAAHVGFYEVAASAGGSAGASRLAGVAGPTAGRAGTVVMLPVGEAADAWKKAPGLAAWRVKGYGPERYVDGGLTGDMVQVETSDENGIVAPLPPGGLLRCGEARGSSVRVGPQAAKAPAPTAGACANPSFICAGEDQYAALSGTVDLSRLPFDPGLPGLPGSSEPLLFTGGRALLGLLGKGGGASAPSSGAGGRAPDAEPQTVALRNVFVDWGDGTEPEPLSVQVGSRQDWRAVRIADGQRHAYRRPSGDKPYQIRIYADADPDSGHPTRTATATSALRGPCTGACAARLGALDRAGAGAAATAVLSARTERTFLVACLDAAVVGAPGEGSDDALHLLRAAISWPEPYASASTPEVVEGSSALVPTLDVFYWGRGKVKVSWFLDGDATPIAEEELSNELPGVGRADGEAGRRPFSFPAAAAVPAPLAGSPHRLTARVTALDPPPAKGTTPDGKVLVLSPSLRSFREVHTIVTASGVAPAPVSPAERVAPGAPARRVVEGVILAIPAADARGGGGDVPPPVPWVDAPARSYSVRARRPGDPHDLLYRTALGDYRVTDVTDFSSSGDGTSSGRGILHVHLPSRNGSSFQEANVPIRFSGWKVDTSGTGDWVAKGGGGDVPLASTTLHPLGFDMKLTAVHLREAGVTVDGAIAIGAVQGVPLPSGTSPPAWKFEGVPLPPAGDLYMELPDAGRLPLGYSGFVLDLAKVVVDFSGKRGKAPPAGGCPAGDAGEGWTGVTLSGRAHLPTFALREGKNLLPDVDFEGFAIGAGGIGADLRADLAASQSVGPITVKAGRLDLAICNGSFDAKVGLEVTGVPLLDSGIQGSIQVTLDRGLLARFEGTAIRKDFRVVKLDIGRASFNYSSEIGDWVVAIESDASLHLPNGAKVFDHQLPSIGITLDGGVKIAGGSDGWFPAGDTGAGDLGGFPVQVTRLGVGLRSNGGLWFGLSGGVRVSDVFEAKGSDVKFLLDRSGGSYRAAGVEVGDLHIDLSLPSVHAVADVTFSMVGSRTRFGGEGEVAVLGSGVGVRAAFLYGNEAGKPYWLAKGALDLGSAAIPLAPTPLAIYGFNGGIAHNIDLTTYGGPVKDVRPRFDGSYLVSAGLQAGTLDGGFTFYGTGALVVRLGGPAAVRLDVDAWMLTDDHAGPPAAKGCMQYAGSAFDAGMTVNLSLAGGAVRVEAPGGADVCTDSAVAIHFGGDGWHVWLGTKERPIAVGLLFVRGQGWLGADASGISAGVGQSVDLRGCTEVLCDFCVYYRQHLLVEVGLGFRPFQAKGSFDSGIAGGISACGANLGFDGSIHLTAQAPNPTQICGSATIAVHVPVFRDPKFSFNVCL